MSEKIKVTFQNGDHYQMAPENTLEDLLKNFKREKFPKIVAARVDNRLRELTYELKKDVKVEFVDTSTLDGIRIYQRSLSFLFIRSAMECFEGVHVNVKHSLSGGLFCELEYERSLMKEDYQKIEKRMRDIVKKDEPFLKEEVSKEEAHHIFKTFKMKAKMHLLKYRGQNTINLYKSGWLWDYFYGYMVPSTGYIECFELKPYNKGVILRHPTKTFPQGVPPFVENPKLAQVFCEAESWAEILGIDYVAKLNNIIKEKKVFNIIRISEALHEKKVAQIADEIYKSKKKLILIAGPSSSGKTTFAQRLMVQLQVNGMNPVTLSTDDYFVDREKTPLDELGQYNFESIKAVDTELFNKDLSRLLMGEEVELPTFDFQQGKRTYAGRKMQVHPDEPIIIEGIHGLNEKLTASISKKDKFKIYISALTQLNIDDHNRIPTTDTRLIRRIVRDNRDRGHSATRTISMWSSVRRGEEKNIFPFQEEADVMFNSALPYELSILKKHAKPLLEGIEEHEPEIVEAKRLLKFLKYFQSVENDELVPYTSILKEFIGGSDPSE